MEPEDLKVRVRVRQWVWDGVVEGIQYIDHLRGAGYEVWQQSHPSLMMVLWKSPWHMGDKTCENTIVPPRPEMVTWSGLPLKWVLYCWT
jgi:hypothetical protein